MRIIYAVLLVLLLSGCGSFSDAYDALFTKGAKFHDEVLQGAVAVKCKGTSAGALTRRYMQTPENWRIWTDECLSGGGKTIPKLPETEDVPE